MNNIICICSHTHTHTLDSLFFCGQRLFYKVCSNFAHAPHTWPFVPCTALPPFETAACKCVSTILLLTGLQQQREPSSKAEVAAAAEMCAETERWCRSSDFENAPVAANIVAWRPQGEMRSGSSVADYKPHSSFGSTSLAGLPFMSSVHEADGTASAMQQLTTAFGTWPLEKPPARRAASCSPESVRGAAMYKRQYNEMDSFTQQLTSSSGVPVLKKWRCRPLRSKVALKLDVACRSLSWSAVKSVQLCEVESVDRHRCTVTLQLAAGDASFVLPSKLSAELLESLLLTLCADSNTISSSSSSSRKSNSCSKRSSCTPPF
jgi:hypothetical protein